MAWLKSGVCSDVRRDHPILVYTSDMVKLFIALGAQSLPAQTFYLMCIALGCRCPAVAAMQWADVDLDDGEWTPKPDGPTIDLPPFLVRRRTRSIKTGLIRQSLWLSEADGVGAVDGG